jgi:tetratricopeptide (TPR) repeat protein
MVDMSPSVTRPVYVSGNVVLQGGAVPPEPIPIERVCNGVAHREGVTDSKGEFQIALGSRTEQESIENTQVVGDPPSAKPSNPTRQVGYEGCELRAILAGYQSTSLLLRAEQEFSAIHAGTIVLTRMGNVEGATISMTSLAAPKEARQAYEKGRKELSQKKSSEAEKNLSKAVQLYPQYAAAWYLLGEVHRQEKELDQAIKDYSQSMASDAQFVSPYFGLAVIAIDQKRWEDAERLTSKIIHLNATAFPLAYFFNGAANLNMGKIDAAEQSARRFQELDVNHRTPDVSLLLAKILEVKQDYAGAAQQLRNYLALVPGSPRAAEIKADADRMDALSVAKQK